MVDHVCYDADHDQHEDAGTHYAGCGLNWDYDPGGGPATTYTCGGSEGSPFGSGDGRYYWSCDELFTLEGGGEDPGGGLPEDFEPAVAGELFVAGFGIIFAFWGLGKVLALVMDIVRR